MNRGRWLIDQLPVAMLDDDFLVRFLGIFQELADRSISHADQLEHLVDVPVAPDAMVRFMGSWLGGNPIDPSLDLETQRRIVRQQGRMLPWRGTVRGLRQLLEMITGGPVVVVDGCGVHREGEAPANPNQVHIEVISTGWAHEDDLVALLVADLPAAVSFELLVAGRRVWPREAALVGSGQLEVTE